MSGHRGIMMVPPVGPGEFLREQVIARLKITQEQLADAMGVSRLSVNQIINGRRTVTAEMALRLAHVTSTTPDFWLNLQRQVDIFEAQIKLANVLPKLKVLRKPKSDTEIVTEICSE